MLIAQLEYPRSGTPVVTTTKMMDLPSRRLVKFDTADFWEAGLFKELIDSETCLYYMKEQRRVDVLNGSELTIDLFATAAVRVVVGHERVPGSNIRRPIQETKLRKNEKSGTATIMLVA